MQIHELNNFTGTLGANSYVPIDDGNDTGKVSTQQILAATEARIDNIIAGDAPSAAEVTDARLGADGVVHSSLGAAIRNQVTDLKAELNDITEPSLNLFDVSKVVGGYISSVDGSVIVVTQSPTSYVNPNYIAVQGGGTYTFSPGRYILSATYDSDKVFIERVFHDTANVVTYGDNVAYVRLVANGGDFFTNNFMFVNGDTLPTEFIPYGVVIKDSGSFEHITNKASDINSDNPITDYPSAMWALEKANTLTALANGVSHIRASINLWNDDKISLGRLDVNGKVIESSSGRYSDYIKVESGKYLLCSYAPYEASTVRYLKNMNVTAYDKYLNVLPDKGMGTNAGTYLIPQGVAFVKVSMPYYTDGVNNMIEMSSTNVLDEHASHYEPYYETYYDPKGEVTMADLESAIAETEAYASQVVNAAVESIELPSQLGVISYTIDQFEGETMEDKLHNALDTIPKGIITCGNITLTKKYIPIDQKNYRGITIADSVLTIGIDGWWDGQPQQYPYNYCPQFDNCVISCINGNAIFTAADDTGLISPTFVKCYFQNPVILNSNTVWMQSLKVRDCEFQTNAQSSFCKAYRYWDLNFIGNRVEAGSGVLFESTYEDSGWAVYHAVFKNNIFEGRSDAILNLGAASDIQIKENYFEHNFNPWFNITKPIDVFIFADNYVNEGNPEEDTACFVITERPTTEIIQNNALLLVGTGKVLVRYA